MPISMITIEAPPGRLGFTISQQPNQGVVVAVVDPDSPLLGKIRVGDQIASVNSHFVPDCATLVRCLSNTIGSHRTISVYREVLRTETVAPAAAAAAGDGGGSSNMRPFVAAAASSSFAKKPEPKSVSFLQPAKREHSSIEKRAKKNPPAKKAKTSKPPWLPLDDPPEPGTVDPTCQYYSTLDNETLSGVAEKLGTDWKELKTLNDGIYGELIGRSIFKRYTLLRIPQTKSAWKMKVLQLKVNANEEQDECVDCGLEKNHNLDCQTMLVCDGCDAPHHLRCANLLKIPTDDWFCPPCLQVLQARRQYYGNTVLSQHQKSSIPPQYQLPAVPHPKNANLVFATQLRGKLSAFLTQLRDEAMAGPKERLDQLYQQIYDKVRTIYRVENQVKQNPRLRPTLENFKRDLRELRDER